MNGFAAEPAELGAAMAEAFSRVARSHHYVLGPEVQAFEESWAAACGTRHAVGVANGLDAIEIALRALGIGPGDEVITTPMTAFASVLGIIRAGATPVLADIDPATALLSPDSVRRSVTPATRAVLLVHLYGQVRGMRAWTELADELGIELIEDCAQSHLAQEDGTVAGGFGRIAAYSFYPTKNLGALGDAGAVVTSDDQLAQASARLRNYGQSVRYEHPDLGLNSRLDEVQAAILSERLRWLPAFTERRREVATRYQQELTNPAVRLLSAPTAPGAHVHHLYVICSEHRDQLAEHVALQGVQTLIHYPIPLHLQASLPGVARDPSGLVHAENHARTCLSLPCHPQLTDDEVSAVVSAVNSFRT